MHIHAIQRKVPVGNSQKQPHFALGSVRVRGSRPRLGQSRCSPASHACGCSHDQNLPTRQSWHFSWGPGCRMCKVARSDGCKLSATSPSSTTSQLSSYSKNHRPANPVQSIHGMCHWARLTKHATQLMRGAFCKIASSLSSASMTVHPAVTHKSGSSEALRGGSCFRRKLHIELHTPSTRRAVKQKGCIRLPSRCEKLLYTPSPLSLSLNFRASMIDVPFHFFCLAAGHVPGTCDGRYREPTDASPAPDHCEGWKAFTHAISGVLIESVPLGLRYGHQTASEPDPS